MLAHNSVDRDLMARDSIELTQYDDVVSKGRSGRSTNSELKLGAQANSRTSTDNEDQSQSRARIRSAHPGLKSGASTDFDDSELGSKPVKNCRRGCCGGHHVWRTLSLGLRLWHDLLAVPHSVK